MCARKYPYVRSSRNQEVGWVQPVDYKNETIFGQSLGSVEKLLGMKTFREKYVDKETVFARQEMTAELEAWACQVDFAAASVQLVCCPEDKSCHRRCRPKSLCSQCWVPLCRSCKGDLVWHGRQPAAALSNDMMVYYGPREAYSVEVTVMEMLCASPCLTTMICFSLEQKLRGDRALDQDAWMNRQRMAVRGNATTFPLAWEDLLQQLQDLEKKPLQKAARLKLPHCGAKLREVVNVIVKSHKRHETLDVSRIVHQARVRRAVVVRLIEDAVARGHPAFQGIEMEQMYSEAKALPEDGVPDEVVAMLPYDEDLNCIMRQKAATPVRQEMCADELAEEMKSMAKPNAVVGERTSLGMADVNAQHVSALQATAARSQGPESVEETAELTLRTGNRLLDQFRPQYFGFAFPYVFKFCTGMPDPPAWSAVERYRRDESAPRVELQEWVQIMARRCEAQVCRDCFAGKETTSNAEGTEFQICLSCLRAVSDQQNMHRGSRSSANLREAIPSERRCCGREICCLHMSILQGPCEQQCEDRENQPSGCLWVQIFGTGRRCRKEKFCLPVPILQWTCEQQREDRANRPSICVQQSILRQGR